MSKSTIDGRPKPPSNLSSIQKKIWKDVVASEAASYFESPANQHLLSSFTFHCESAAFLADNIKAYEAMPAPLAPDDVKAYGQLLKMRESETRALTSVATRLRLTNQSRYTPQAAATAAKNTGSGSKPWDDDL